MSSSLIIYLIMGTTVYLLMFKRSFMIESNRISPKIYMGMVCAFGVAIMALKFGFLDKVLFS